METIGIAVATYGDSIWHTHAQATVASFNRQSRLPDEVMAYHGTSLAQARNEAVSQLHSEYVILVDADDRLDDFYLDQMLLAEGDIRYPRVRYEYANGGQRLVSFPKGDLRKGNFCVIGSMFRRDGFLRVRGFRDEPILEDWSLWLRMAQAGARVEPSLAIYIARVRENGRNSDERLKAEWTRIIQAY